MDGVGGHWALVGWGFRVEVIWGAAYPSLGAR
jgi:hypothetical protein